MNIREFKTVYNYRVVEINTTCKNCIHKSLLYDGSLHCKEIRRKTNSDDNVVDKNGMCDLFFKDTN